MHLLFKQVMCGMNDSLESNIRPRNLASPIVGIGVPFRLSWDLNDVFVVDKNERT